MTNIKKDNTEEKILIAAQNVFVRKGMDGARMQEIADEAGINKALLHYYFRSKQQLFHATFESVFCKIIPNVMRMVESDQPIEEKLDFFIENYIDVLMKNPFLPTFVLKEINQDPEFLAELIKSSGLQPKKVVEMFKTEMEKGTIRTMDPRDLLISILSLNIFPIASKPLLSLLFFDDDQKSYTEFIERRKVTVKEFVLNSILIK
ncbi:TetR/AcrR family transcriptional regulator [Draconibacterium sp. IB214405]|uniref:TetR/AcrR family transcriptional regulator n=1 Tax=Draconibacterium sp. IB214405 TaxID=3097352 RepID=UPI002A0BB8C2|nr:TetR/AcrR family transcriptional regulator [Draconibacterium sp. IB214405]MDX8340588.1 TetR/AcrR family transcriptional regulator [Draconibacterium sp. IB214405]